MITQLMSKQKDTHYLAFTSSWFQKHQKLLVILFNLVYKLFPSLFFKSGERDDFKGNKIIEVGNNHATCDAGLQYFKKSDLIKTASENPANNHKDRRIYKTILRKIKQGKIKEEMKLLPTRKTVFFTDWNYSKMLYNAFKPMWWAMHYWDELFADKWVPKLSFGFSTLEVSPGSIGTNNPVDGYMQNWGDNQTWADVRNAAGNDSAYTGETGTPVVWIQNGSVSGFIRIMRSIFCFDTSALTSEATISATVLSLYGTAKEDSVSITPDINIYLATPASTTSIANGDYAQIGTTAQCDTAITYSGFSTTGFNAFTFNATGIGNVSKTGISKFGARNANKDVANSAPPYTGSMVSSSFTANYSNAGSNKPKLVVTYTTVVGPANVKTYNGLAAASVKTINGLAIASVKTYNGLN